MLVRIVKMTFAPEKVDEFLVIFNGSKKQIRSFDGCKFLELLRDMEEPCVFFTHSHWISQEHLNNYRKSDLFQSTWMVTRELFAEKAEAWSLQVADRLPLGTG